MQYARTNSYQKTVHKIYIRETKDYMLKVIENQIISMT